MDRREFEKELQAYRGNDPLEVWQRYIQRVEKCCPADTKESTLAELLDSCIRTFNNKPQYKTDQRYVSVWIKYASFCKEPVEIFSYMQKNGIGVQFAIFYEAWADATWQSGRSQNANLILQEGISCQAQPLDRLKKKQEIFQKKSQAASTAGGQSKPMVNDENADPNKIFRVNGYSHNRNTNHISTQKINDENLKPSAPPQVHGDQDENAYSNLQPNQRIMYCKEKLMNGREELSFEELRAKRWLEKRKKEQEIRAIILNEQKHGMEEERRLFLEEMEKNRAMLAKEAEQIRQDREKMRQEHENMRLMYQQQLQQMNSDIDRSQQQQQQQEIITATQKQQQQMQERVNLQQQQQLQERVSLQQQQQMQERVNLQQQQQQQMQERANLQQQQQQQMQERANRQQKQQQMQERANLQQQQQQQQMQERANLQQQQQQQMQERENLQQQKQMQEMNRMRQQQHQEAMEVEVQQALASQLSISDKQLSGLRTREKGAIKNLNFGSDSLMRSEYQGLGDHTEDFGLRPIISQKEGSANKTDQSLRYTPIDQSLSTPNDSQTSRQFSSGRPSLTAPSPTVNTKEALQLVQGFFNASLDLEKDLGWGSDAAVPQRNDAAPAFPEHSVEPIEQPKASGGLMFSIYDETQDKENPPAPVQHNTEIADKENCGQPAIPRQNLMSVKSLAEKPKPLSQAKKMEFSVLQDTHMEGIESQAREDCTIAPVGSHLSFAAAATIASTPFHANASHEPLASFNTLDLGEESKKTEVKDAQKTTESIFSDVAMQINNLSPIMEGSNEESSVGDSVMPSNRTRNASADQKPNSHYPTDMDNHNESVPHIDTSGYMPHELDEKTEALLSMSIRIDPQNPFDSDTIQEFLSNLPQPLSTFSNYVDCHDEEMEPVTQTIVSFGGDLYSVEKLIGKGGYATVYKASTMNFSSSGDMQEDISAMKIEKPGNPWEFYICSVISERLRNLSSLVDVSQAMMSIQKGYFFQNASCLVTEYFAQGTMLDLVNLVRKLKIQVHQSIAMYWAIELIRVVESLQKCDIIHGDIKPDNFLVRGLQALPMSSDPDVVFGGQFRPFHLIDFGQSIDMTKYPPGTTFMATVKTSGFQCIEMKTNMPWTYQTDMFGLAGTLHVLLFGQYMKVYKTKDEWRMNSTINRSWSTLWKSFFHTMLNVPSCFELPDLGEIRRQFESYFIENLLKGFNKQQGDLQMLLLNQG